MEAGQVAEEKKVDVESQGMEPGGRGSPPLSGRGREVQTAQSISL